MNKKFNKKTKKVTALVLAACMMLSIVGSFAYFTDRADTKATATAGSLAINLDDKGIKLTDTDGKDILNPGDIRDIYYTVTNVGNKSMDVKETITLSIYDSVGQTLNIKGDATTQSEVDLYNKADITAYNTTDGYTLADGATPVQVKTINNNVITYKPDMYTLNGSSIFDEQEVETGIDTDKHTTDLKLVFDKLAANKFQGAVVKMDVLVEAKQHRNTSAYNTDWTELQTETYVFSNGASEKVVKAVNADVPEKLQLMTADGVAKAFAPTANMVIPATVDGSAVTGIVDEAYKGETVIETVEIPASVTTIGTSAFEDCTNLNTLTLNEGLQTIKTAAFKNTALSTVSIPSTVTNVTEDNKLDIFDDGNEIVFVEPESPEDTNQYTIDKTEFKTLVKDKTGVLTFSTTPLTTQTGTDLSETKDNSIVGVVNGNDVTIYSKNGKIYAPENSSYMFGMFEGAGDTGDTADFNISSIDVSGLDTSKVTNMNAMFHQCSAIKTLDLSNFDTSNVTDMNQMFARCTNLTNIDLSSFDTSNVTNMNGVFDGCFSLEEVNLNNFNTSKVTRMSNMFSGCSSLANLDLSSFDTSNVTNTGWMFGGCDSLTSITARTEADKTNLSTGTSLPAGCTITVKSA